MNMHDALQPHGAHRTADAGPPLAPGSVVDGCEITRVLATTSVGTLYAARDLHGGRALALKEYLPPALSRRSSAGEVELLDAANELAFQRGLQSFINEALDLSRVSHPNLLKVDRVWEAGGTAFRAMPWLEGNTLQVARSQGEPATQALLQVLLDGLLAALAALHDAGLAHGHIEPANIVVRDDGQPVLLDFGAVQAALASDMDQPYADAYADPARLHALFMGDLKAVAAVLHFAISGDWQAPQAGRRYEPLADVLLRLQDSTSALGYQPDFLNAIDAALALAPDHPTASISEFQALFVPPAEREAHAAMRRAAKSRNPAARTLPAPPPATDSRNASENVLALLANFGRGPAHAAEDVEPFVNPPVPTLTEEAEPAMPPLREPLFDLIDAGEAPPEHGVTYGRGGFTPMPRIRRNPWRQRAKALGLAAFVLACLGALGWQLMS